MPEIAIVHDSASSLPRETRVADNPRLVEVHFTVTVNGEDKWIDRPFESDDKKTEFIDDLLTARVGTAQPNVSAYLSVFRSIIESGVNEIAVVPMSGTLSGSIQSAKMAAEEIGDEARVAVADCKSASVGQGLLVTQADIENRRGLFNNAQDLATRVEQLSGDLAVAQAFQGLEHLREGGRAGAADSMAGSILSTVPIIGLDNEGGIKPISEKRTWRQARGSILDYISNEVGERPVRLAIVGFGTEEFEAAQVGKLREEAEERFVMAGDPSGAEYDIMVCEQSMVLGVHSGPGVVGMGALALV